MPKYQRHPETIMASCSTAVRRTTISLQCLCVDSNATHAIAPLAVLFGVHVTLFVFAADDDDDIASHS